MTPLDVAVRHQAYVEGLKNYEEDSFDGTAEALAVLLAALLVKWGFKKLADMPKRTLAEFTAYFNQRALKLTKAFEKKYLRELRAIADADRAVTKLNYENLTATKAVVADPPLLWSQLSNAIVPATGALPIAMVKDFTVAARRQVLLFLRRGAAEGWTNAALLAGLTGTRARNYKDGLLPKIKTQFYAMSETVIQHIHAWLQFNIGKVFYDNYQWISVLDGRTTEICRSRAGRVFSYATGPRPPAHYRCRSTIVGIQAKSPLLLPGSFYDWLKAQPIAVLQDLIGATRTRQLRANDLGAADFPKFDGVRKLSPEQFETKQTRMTA